MKTVGLFPGGFKPPHKGHFKVLKELSEKVDEVIIFIGPIVREGETVSPVQSKQILDLYSTYISTPVSIEISQSSPVLDVIRWLKVHNKDYSNIIIGTTEERVKRYEDVIEKNNYENTNLFISSLLLDKESKISGSEIRSNKTYYYSLDWIPEVITLKDRQKIEKILKMKKTDKIQERMVRDVERRFKDFFPKEEKKEKLEEGSSGTPINPRAALPSNQRNKLVRLYNQLRNIIYLPTFDVDFQQDRIVIKLRDTTTRIGYDYTPYMSSILEHMMNEGFNITPLPEIKIKKDIEESVDIFGKTAHYDPNNNEITLFVMNRHPKDVLRSFTHEMIHHKQNLEGRIKDINTSNTNEDNNLLELEKEAYLEGNILFRNWEDKIKNEINN